MNFFRFLVHSNVYIALGALFLTLETQALIGLRLQWHPYMFIVFFAVLVDYNFHRLATVLTNKEALNAPKHAWVKKNEKLFFGIVIGSIAGFLIAISQAKQEVLLALLPMAGITVFYTVPFLKVKNHFIRLRDIPGLKIFLISFVWAYVTVYLPVIQTDEIFSQTHIALIFLERFLFAFAITLPFDIRDMEADKNSGLITIPILLGEQAAMKLSRLIIMAFLVICTFHYLNSGAWHFVAAFFVSSISTMYITVSRKLQVQSFLYYSLLDATILFQGILVCAFWLLAG